MSVRALFCGAWDDGPGYPRARSLRQGLEALGASVAELRVPGLGRRKQQLLQRPWRWPGAVWSQRASKAALFAQLGRREPTTADVVVVPYPGHAVVRGVRERVRSPVVLDLFLSAYDTVVEDRAVVRPGSLGALWLQRLDTRACAAADLVLLDTPENAAYVQALTGLPADRFAWLPVHDPDAPARAAPLPELRDGDPLRVLFFGTGVPLHGLGTLVDAVAAAPHVHLTLVGGAPRDRDAAQRRLGARLTLAPGFVERAELATYIEASHVVAGVFGGASSKVERVVPFKVVHALAAGRPVLTADTPAIARWLDGSGAVFAVPVGDAPAIARLLEQLAREPARVAAAAAAARPAYDRHFGTERLAARWRELLARLVPGREAGAA